MSDGSHLFDFGLLALDVEAAIIERGLTRLAAATQMHLTQGEIDDLIAGGGLPVREVLLICSWLMVPPHFYVRGAAPAWIAKNLERTLATPLHELIAQRELYSKALEIERRLLDGGGEWLR